MGTYEGLFIAAVADTFWQNISTTVPDQISVQQVIVHNKIVSCNL